MLRTRMRLGPCKTGLSTPVGIEFLCCLDLKYVFIVLDECFSVDILCCLRLMCVFIFLFTFG